MIVDAVGVVAVRQHLGGDDEHYLKTSRRGQRYDPPCCWFL